MIPPITNENQSLDLGLSHCDLPFSLPSDLVSVLFRRDLRFSGKSAGRQRRQIEFQSGRLAAGKCLESLGLGAEVGSADDRSPIWPTGAVGSISHSDLLVWSTVGLTTDYAAVGIDTEPIADEKTFSHLREEILGPGEAEFGKANGLNSLQTFTTIFSAKECFYKCIYPLNPMFFGFQDARITKMDSQTVTIQLTDTSPNQFNNRRPIAVEYSVTQDNVFTACWLRNYEI